MDKKPVVPQYVADMIVKRKKQGDSLVTTLVNLGAFGDAQRWIRKGDNSDTFAKAWLYGYEIEKDKLYTVELPNPNSFGFGSVILLRNNEGKIYISFSFFNRETWRGAEKAQLTEAEIKKDFDWAWKFAEEV